MGKILIANWCKSEEMLGGQESFFGQLSRDLDARMITYTMASNILKSYAFMNSFNILYRSYVMDKYLRWYEKLFDLDLIIKNSAIEGFTDLSTPQIIVFQDPYYSILKEMLNRETFIYNPEHHLGCIELMRRQSRKSNTTTVAVSNFMKEEMRLCDIECDKVIEEGIDVERFKPSMNKDQVKMSHGLPLDKKIGIAITKFIPQKGWGILSKLINKFKDIHWIVVLTEKAEIKIKSKNVTILQQVLPDVMPHMYNCADFLVNTSPVESFGLSALEAASCGLPIITYKTGWAWDWFDSKLGIRVDKWDYESFGMAVEEIKKSDFSKFSPRRVVIERGFTAERMSKDWKAFVENLIKK